MDSDGKLFDRGEIAPVNNQVIDVYRSAHLRLELPVQEHNSWLPPAHSKNSSTESIIAGTQAGDGSILAMLSMRQ